MVYDRRIAVAVALVGMSAPLAWAQNPAAEQQRAIAAIRALGGKVDATRAARIALLSLSTSVQVT